MHVDIKQWYKFALGFVICLIIRLIPFRPPNIEPIMATVMPFSRAYGNMAGFFFAFASIMLFDLIVGNMGTWTLITALAYGLVGIGAALYLKHKKNTAWNYACYAIISTLFFDAVTGLTIGPLFFGQPLGTALVGQIPFTLFHLIGNVSFALILSPALYAFLRERKRPEAQPFINLIPKHL